MSKDLLPVRLSHLLSHAGVGAIVRGPNGYVVVQDIRHWTRKDGEPGGDVIPYVERVRAVLGVTEELRLPPLAKERKAGQPPEGVCVPATRFPLWMRCPDKRCGALYFAPWRDDQAERQDPRCQRELCGRKPRLEQVPWVLVDARGFLADVPWRHLAHMDARDPRQSACKLSDRLRLAQDGEGRTLLFCEACGCTQRFNGNERPSYGAGRTQPWAREDLAPSVTEPKDGSAQVLAINDARVHVAETMLALVIPPESRVRKGTPVDRLYRSSQDRERIRDARNDLQRKAAMVELARTYRCSRTDLEDALNELEKGYPTFGQTFTPDMVAEDEYRSFADEPLDLREDEDFVPRNRSEAWRALVEGDGTDTHLRALASPVTQLIRVDRLKGIRVFSGFRRLKPDSPLVPPDLVGASTWLPAIELYGEGIFFTLDLARLSAWEQHASVQRRLSNLTPRYEQTGGGLSGRREAPNPLTARFVLLHTLSHLLMRQIESEGGYPAASLSERIYCAGAPTPMAGILIWVGVPDVAGSLGGLAELAEPSRFLRIVSRAVEHARWCSLDPVCGEHEGQGPGLLNRAACHACTLVPEPACNHGNTLLDRGFVCGDQADGMPSLFAPP